MLGHKSAGYRTTEIYAKFDPDYLGKAVAAIDDYFAELQASVKRTLILPKDRPQRASCVSVEESVIPQVPVLLVEPGGIEPPTSTMPL